MVPFQKPDRGADDPAWSIRYARYVFQWWQAGNRNGFPLYRDLRAQGYRGSSKAMYRYLERLRTPQRRPLRSFPSKLQGRKSVPVSPAPRENFSAHRAAWLFVRQPEELDETQQAELALIRQAGSSAEAAYCLAQAFMQMIRERTGHQLDIWLKEADASRLPEFKSIARGIRQDKAAVLAGLTLPWSQGPLEGHVNRLKLLKRSMYGRAKLPLLRSRVLQVA
jgi:transposase